MVAYTLMQKGLMLVMGIECSTSNAPDAAPQDIPRHWAKFVEEGIMDQIPNKSSNEVIALYCDYEGDYTEPYSFVLGCPVNSADEIPEGMVVKIIPESTYAVFKATGDYPQSLITTWGQIWQSTDLKRTYTGDFEVYGEKFYAQTPQEVDVWVAIDPAQE
jgi:predicted transcriptional regulator YdeE